ncbi:MAG: hypothetical protein QF898_20310 [SAR202 cluster bacterium]|nr:hypothetical protein [SAR202 cluster bacterium]MDP6714139.1 hypothetical protein [SAR202 cluster bacterium]
MPDGFTIRGIAGEYVSSPVPVLNGEYELLTMNPGGLAPQRTEIVFLLENVPANEKDVFIVAGVPILKLSYHLTFPNLPGSTPTPTPVPSAAILTLTALGGSLLLLSFLMMRRKGGLSTNAQT